MIGLGEPAEAKVIELLSSSGPMSGLALVEASGGVLRRWTVYVLLNRMVDNGYLESRQEDDPSIPGLPRRIYTTTRRGQKVFAESARPG